MKKINLLLLFSIFAIQISVHAQAVWVQQISGTTASLNAVQFLDANNGYAAGSGGTVLKTTNGGATWGTVNITTPNPIQEISFIDALNGWAVVGDPFNWQTSGSVWKTTNGGTTWAQQTFTGSAFAGFSVKFINANTGWVGFSHDLATGKNIYSTTNGGTSYATNPTPADWFWTYGIDFVDPSNGWAVCNNNTNGVLFNTSNGGPNWLPQTAANLPFMYGIDFVNANVGFAVGNAGTIKATTNGGVLWSTQTSSTLIQLNDVSFTNITTGWTVGNTGNILMTTDGGTTWLSETSGTTQDINDVSSTSTLTAYAVGNGGVILKRALSTGITQYSNTNTQVSVYPNPVTSTATFKINGSQGNNYSLSIIDFTGREVKQIEKIASSEFTISRDELSNGIYFYSLLDGEKNIATGKLVVSD